MASRNEVLTLFGATPEQIMEKQRREQAAMVLNQQDPFARAGSAIGVGLARLFGGESADVQEARRLQGAQEGISLDTPEGMRAAAQRLQELGFTDRALQLNSLADQRETANIARDLEGKVTVNKEVSVEVPWFDPVNQVETSKVVTIDVPYEWDRKTGTLKSIFGSEYEKQLAQQKLASAPQAEVTPDATTTQPQARIEDRMATDLAALPIGESYQLPTTGRWVRKLPDGKFEYLTPEQLNQEAGITDVQKSLSGF